MIVKKETDGMKHVLCWILCLTLLLSCCPVWAEETAVQEKAAVHQIEKKTIPMYMAFLLTEV